MLADIIKERIKKIKELKKVSVDPYPEKTGKVLKINNILQSFSLWQRNQKKVAVAGRIWAIRGHGGVMFLDIEDATGKIQVVIKKDLIGKKNIEFLQKFLDLGDFWKFNGVLMVTQRGEKSLLVKKFQLLTKSIHPLPKSWYGLSDDEERYRRRYLDLLENKDVKNRFILRSKIIAFIRHYLIEDGYLEVETPILQSVYGGAAARPFVTKLNALKTTLYLRIAPELYLKRLIIGGFEKIFEIGKCFRNEGVDREHNPEFTILELYSAYQTRDDLMKLVKQLFKSIVKQFRTELPSAKLLNKKWRTISLEDFLYSKTHLHFRDSVTSWKKVAHSLDIKTVPNMSRWNIIDNVFKKYRRDIKAPTFVIDIPVELSPLAKRLSNNSTETARFLLIINGWEITNAFSELNDPLDQRQRFEDQLALRKKGDLEAHPLDADFVEALEYGMPPTAGLGIGIDRLIAVLTGAPSLKEVILFPFMKPSHHNKD